MAEAAAARAALKGLGDDAVKIGDTMTAAATKITTAETQVTKAIDAQKLAMGQAADAAQRYNKFVNFGGRDTVEQHLADLQREDQLTTLLQRARQRGFMTPQQDYAWRQQEYNQLLLWNRAANMGYSTPEQYLLYLQRERQSFESQTAAWRARDDMVRGATATMVAYTNAIGGTHLTAGQLATANTGIQQLSATLAGLPDTATTTISVDDAAAKAEIATYESQLAGVPRQITTHVNVDMSPAQARGAIAIGPPREVVQPAVRPVIPSWLGPSGMTDWNAVMSGLVTAQRLVAAGAAEDASKQALQAAAINATGDAATSATAKLALLSVAQAAANGDKGGAGVGGGGRGGGGFVAGGAGFGTQLALFGGAASIGVVHLLVDLGIELAATVIPSIIAGVVKLGSYALATAADWKSVYQWFQAINTVSTATGQNIKPMTGALQQMNNALRPAVIQQTGDLLLVLGHNTGYFQQQAQQTAGWLNQMGAKFVYAVDKGQGFRTLVSTGTKDLAQFGDILKALGAIFMDFVHASEITHVAEDLLHGLALALQGVANALHALGPAGTDLLALGIALHGIFVYGGLAVTGLQTLGITISGLMGKFGPLSESAYTFAQNIGASNDQLARIGMTSPAVKSLVNDLAVGSPAAYKMAQGLGITDENLAKVVSKTPAVQKAADALGQSAQDVALLAVNSSKAGVGLEEVGAKAASSDAKLASLRNDLSGVSKDAGNLVLAAGGGAAAMEKLTAKEAEAGAKTGLLAGAGASLSRVFGVLVDIPVAGWLLAAGAAFAGLLTYIEHTNDSTQSFIAGLQKGLENSPLGQLQARLNETFVAAIGGATKYGTQLGNLTAREQQLMDWQVKLNTAIGASGYAKVTKEAAAAGIPIGDLSDAIKATQVSITNAQIRFNDWSSYISNILNPETDAAGKHLQALAGLFGGNLTQGLAAATLAGVTSSQVLSTNYRTWAEALIQVKALIAGYEAMGQRAGTLGSDLNAVTYAASDQLKAVQQLNQAWDTTTANVAGPINTLQSLRQSMLGFQSDAKVAGASMVGLGKNVVTASGAVAGGAGSITNSSLQLQSDFQTVYSNANQMLDALRTSGVPAGVFNGVVKQMVAALLPMAGASKAARAEVSVLAQEAGGPATTSLKQLQDWAGKTENPLRAMQKATDNAAIALSNVAEDARKANQMLSALSTQMEVASIASADGLRAAWTKYADDLNKYHSSTAPQVQNDLKNINDILNKAQNQVEATVKSQDRLTRSQDQNTAHLQTAESTRKQLINDLLNTSGNLHNAMQAFDQYTADILANETHTAAAHATRRQLIQDLIDSGVNAQTARRLVDEYTTSVTKIPKSWDTKIAVQATGVWKVTEQGFGGTQTPFHRSAQGGFGRAAGGYVDMTQGEPGSDSVPAMLMPGEYVVRTAAVQRYGKGVFEAMNNLQMAGGGSVSGSDFGTPPAVGNWAYSEDQTTLKSVEQSAADAIKNYISQQQTSLRGSFGKFSSSGVTGSAAAALAWGFAHNPWPSQWGDLKALWMQESGWNPYAVNASSGAYGIPQSLGHGHPYNLGDYIAQELWGFNYIRQTYGDAANAWAHEVAFNWYRDGGDVDRKRRHHGPGGSMSITLGTTPSSGFTISTPSQGAFGTGAGFGSVNEATKIGGKLGAGNQAQQWQAAWNALVSAEGAFNQDITDLTGRPWTGVPSTQQTKLQSEIAKIQAAMTTATGDWGLLTAITDPTQMTVAELQQVGSDFEHVYDKVGIASAMRKYGPQRYHTTGKDYSGFSKAMGNTITAWNALYGPHGLHHPGNFPATPGPAMGPPAAAVAAAPLSLLIPTRAYASGGPVFSFGAVVPAAEATYSPSPAMGFASGGLVSVTGSGSAPAGAVAAAQAPPQTAPFIGGDLVVNNPLPEPAGESVTRAVNRTAFLAGRGVI